MISKDERAKKILGLRSPGTPIFGPGELGYACPICGRWGDDLHWSEYNAMIWCEGCNVDIPSCFCKLYPSPHVDDLKQLSKKDRVIENTKVFLNIIEEVQNEI